MKRLLALLLVIASSLQAAEWRNDAYGCSIHLIEVEDWEPAIATPAPGITVLVAMQNTKRQASFLLTALENPPGTDLNDAKVQSALGQLLRSFTYEFVGFSKVNIGGLTWLQYPVTSRAGGVLTKGVVRFASGNGRIYGITMLLGGGKEAVQDVEMQAMAASFRLIAPGSIAAATPVAPDAGANTAASGVSAPAAPGGSSTPAPAADAEPEKKVLGNIPESYVRYGGIAVAALLVLIVLGKIIGGGKPQKK